MGRGKEVKEKRAERNIIKQRKKKKKKLLFYSRYSAIAKCQLVGADVP